MLVIPGLFEPVKFKGLGLATKFPNAPLENLKRLIRIIVHCAIAHHNRLGFLFISFFLIAPGFSEHEFWTPARIKWPSISRRRARTAGVGVISILGASEAGGGKAILLQKRRRTRAGKRHRTTPRVAGLCRSRRLSPPVEKPRRKKSGQLVETVERGILFETPLQEGMQSSPSSRKKKGTKANASPLFSVGQHSLRHLLFSRDA